MLKALSPVGRKHALGPVLLPPNCSQSVVLTQIIFLQMMETLEDTLSAIEDNMSLRLSKIEHRLDSLEKVVSCCSCMGFA